VAGQSGWCQAMKSDMGGWLGLGRGAGMSLENGGAGGVSRGPTPRGRLGGQGVRGQLGRLHAVDGDGVGFVAYLELEGERRAA
jgi:hypothetical protein